MIKQKKYSRCLLGMLCAAIAASSLMLPRPASAALRDTQEQEMGIIAQFPTTDLSHSYYVDFEYIRQKNSDTVGWLFQSESGINQPIMQAVDNEYYTRRSFGKGIDALGSLFVDSRNTADFSDKMIYLYGSNHSEGGALLSIKQYFEKSATQLPSFRLITPDREYQLDVFAGYKTTMKDSNSYMLASCLSEREFDLRMMEIEEKNQIETDDESMPEWDDQILTLVTTKNSGIASRYVLYMRMRPIALTDAPAIDVSKITFDYAQTQNGYVELPNIGRVMAYAQNDPLWNHLYYESANHEKRRPFGQGGCGPTAVAMAVANLVPKEDLTKILDYASETVGYTFCNCSVNNILCSKQHVQYQVTTADELLRYLPIVLADFACGNNTWNVKSRLKTTQGTNMKFLEPICQVYGLNMENTADIEVAMAAFAREKTIVLGCAIRGGPFTASSHYVALAGVDAEYLYVLDPFRRDSYPLDTQEIAEIITPGVVRIKLEDVDKSQIYSFIILTKADEQK